MIIILNSIVNIIWGKGGDLYDHLMSTKESGYNFGLGFGNHLVLIVCFIFQEKWASPEIDRSRSLDSGKG